MWHPWGPTEACVVPVPEGLRSVSEDKKTTGFYKPCGRSVVEVEEGVSIGTSDNPLKGNESLAQLPSAKRKYVGNCRCSCCGDWGSRSRRNTRDASLLLP